MRIDPSLSFSSEVPDRVALEHLPEEAGTRAAARAVLDGRQKGILALPPFLGSAFIACIASIGPGNSSTTIQGGSAFLARSCCG